MSFILEALRKSEHERQKQTGPMVANPYAGPRRPQLPLPLGWMIGIAALLLINIVVVLVLVLRNPAPEQTASTPPVETPPPPAVVTPPPPTAVQTSAGAPPESAPPTSPAETPAAPVEAPALVAERGEPLEAPPRGHVPTLNELNLQGVDALPPLHLDIHVYAAKPAERFVFLNSRKYREGAQTSEGLTIERITEDGVILNRNGLRFLLPRP